MSSKDVNDIVNRLATDPDFWNQFHSNPDHALAGSNLTPAERATLEAIPRQNLPVDGLLADFGQPSGVAVEVITPSDLSEIPVPPCNLTEIPEPPCNLSELPEPPCNLVELPTPPCNLGAARQPGQTGLRAMALPGTLAIFLLILCVALGFGPVVEQVQRLTNPPSNVEQARPREPVPTEDNPTPVGPVEVARGACGDGCNPAASICQAGLICLPGTAGGTDYMCWNNVICATIVTESANPSVTEAVSTEAPQQCGPGWLPAGGCVCCGSSLVCADGTVAQFNPACMGGEDTGGQPPVCGDGVCGGGETCWSCSADCGPC